MPQPHRYSATRPEVSVSDAVSQIQNNSRQNKLLGIQQNQDARQQTQADQREVLFNDQQSQLARQKQGMDRLQQVLSSGDDIQIADFVQEYPEMRKAVEQSMGFSSDLTKQRGISAYTDAGRLLRLGDDKAAISKLQEHARFVRESGGDPAETIASIVKISEDPKAALAEINVGLASMVDKKTYLDMVGAKEEEKTTNIADAEGGGFIGIQGDKSIFIPPPSGKRTQKQADAERANAEKMVVQDIKNTDEVFDRAAKLRGEVSKVSSDFNKIDGAYNRIQASAKEPSAAGDLALIFNYMKMLDPGSTVREGEFATAQNAAGVGARAMNMYNKLLTGERLNPKQRKDFLGQAKNIYDASLKANNKAVNKLINIGSQFGVSRENIVGGAENGADEAGNTEYSEGTVIQNPSTGQTMVMRNGQWEPQ